MQSSRATFVCFATALATTSTSFAQEPPIASAKSRSPDESERNRREERPTLQELREESDAVLIVTMISEGLPPSGERPEGFKAGGGRAAIVTKVAVVGVLAGDVDDEAIEIVHDRYADPVVNLSRRSPAKFRTEIEWPEMIGIDFGGERLKYSAAGDSQTVRPQYLVYLVRRPDGRFELTTGKYGNGSASVRLFDGREAR